MLNLLTNAIHRKNVDACFISRKLKNTLFIWKDLVIMWLLRSPLIFYHLCLFIFEILKVLVVIAGMGIAFIRQQNP